MNLKAAYIIKVQCLIEYHRKAEIEGTYIGLEPHPF